MKQNLSVATTLCRYAACCVVLALLGPPGVAGDGEVAAMLKERGGQVTQANGVVTAVALKDDAKLTDAEFARLAQLRQLKMLSLSGGLDDARLAQLATLDALEYLQTNLAQISDDGVKPLARLKNLRNLKFFHPGKAFSGAGLIHLAGLPQLERLTVAGSLAFNDDGMAAVAQLPHLSEFRTWHAGGSDDGIRKLRDTKTLKSLHLGQRLTYKPPACPTDNTLAILAEMKSLESLQLEEARLSLPALQQLRQLPALKKLTLGGIDIAREDVERLRSEMPSVKVEWTQPNDIYQRRILALFGAK
jgi:hypothetical protein